MAFLNWASIPDYPWEIVITLTSWVILTVASHVQSKYGSLGAKGDPEVSNGLMHSSIAMWGGLYGYYKFESAKTEYAFDWCAAPDPIVQRFASVTLGFFLWDIFYCVLKRKQLVIDYVFVVHGFVGAFGAWLGVVGYVPELITHFFRQEWCTVFLRLMGYSESFVFKVGFVFFFFFVRIFQSWQYYYHFPFDGNECIDGSLKTQVMLGWGFVNVFNAYFIYEIGQAAVDVAKGGTGRGNIEAHMKDRDQ